MTKYRPTRYCCLCYHYYPISKATPPHLTPPNHTCLPDKPKQSPSNLLAPVAFHAHFLPPLPPPPFLPGKGKAPLSFHHSQTRNGPDPKPRRHLHTSRPTSRSIPPPPPQAPPPRLPCNLPRILPPSRNRSSLA